MSPSTSQWFASTWTKTNMNVQPSKASTCIQGYGNEKESIKHLNRDNMGPLPLPLFSEFIDPAAYPLYLAHGHVDFKSDTIALISKPVKGKFKI